jgi:hypothetical protein
MKPGLAKELKIAGFPIAAYRPGHKFYPPEQGSGWSDVERQHGVTITLEVLEDCLQDIKNGYYCPNLSDLIDACGKSFARLFVVTAIWTAESDDPKQAALGDSPEEAVARLWLALNKANSANVRPPARSR